MPLTLSPASRDDIPRLVQILLPAFANGSLLMTSYPAPPSNQTWWVQTILSQMQHPSTFVMKVFDEENGETISFSK